MPPAYGTRTNRPVRRWCAIAVAAAVAPLLAAVGGVPSAVAESRSSPAAAAAPADLDTSSALAPVRLPGDQRARTYTPAQLRTFERTGGDPAVLAYWTPERMAKARPLDAPDDAKVVERTARALAKQAPESVKPASSTLKSRMKNYPPPVTNFSVTNGKLFIGGYESGSWCSASAVNTPSRRVLITAGHCVHSGAGGAWHSNLVFVPGYNAFAADRDPVGMFQAYQLRTFNAWIDSSDLGRDVGYVTTFSGGDWGGTVVDTVGGHGLAYDGGTEFDTSIFGYPSNRDGGNVMWACWGVATDSSWWDNLSKIGCNFGPGSSGGPWLWQYDNSTGQGYVRSVMSTIDGGGVNRGPYFDTAVLDGLNAADGDW
ncbi:MAG: trypsin-like serine peptidase [Dermatophilaceae bacterium]